MSPNAKAFIALMLATGAAVLANGMLHSSWPDLTRFFCYLFAVILASGFKVVLPGISGTMSVNLMVILISVIELSPAETLVLGCAATLVQTLWHQHRIQPVHVAFNAAQIAIAIELSYLVFHHSTSWLGEQVPLRLMATAVTYFLANTVPVAVVVSLTEHRVFHHIWAECYFWSFSHYLVGAAFAGLVTWSNRRLGWQVSALIVPVVYLVYRSYRLYLGRLEAEKFHVEQMAELHLRTIEALALAIDAKIIRPTITCSGFACTPSRSPGRWDLGHWIWRPCARQRSCTTLASWRSLSTSSTSRDGCRRRNSRR